MQPSNRKYKGRTRNWKKPMPRAKQEVYSTTDETSEQMENQVSQLDELSVLDYEVGKYAPSQVYDTPDELIEDTTSAQYSRKERRKSEQSNGEDTDVEQVENQNQELQDMLRELAQEVELSDKARSRKLVILVSVFAVLTLFPLIFTYFAQRSIETELTSVSDVTSSVSKNSTRQSTTSSSQSANIEVPDVSNMTLEAAEIKLEKAGLEIGTISEIEDPSVTSGLVSQTSPSSGSKVRKGATIAIILSADQVTARSSSNSAQTSSSSSTSQTTPSAVAEEILWNQSKSEQLYNYIVSDWGPRMNQKYQSYTEETPLNYYGVTVPNSLLNPSGDSTQFKGMKPDFNGETPYLVWSKNGLSAPNRYALVAVYADTENVGASPTSHLYLFTIHNGFGQVWITEQNQGNPEQTLYFRETANAELRNYFSQLVSQ